MVYSHWLTPGPEQGTGTGTGKMGSHGIIQNVSHYIHRNQHLSQDLKNQEWVPNPFIGPETQSGDEL